MNPFKKSFPYSAFVLICFATIIGIAGCAVVGPNYLRPETDTPKAWNNKLSAGTKTETAEPQMLAQWWKTLNDPVLSGLIERAVTGNSDIKNAFARIREARARRGISDADRFPSADGSGAVTARRSNGSENKSYTIGVDASWELDLFGGVSRSIEAAQANLESEQENLRNVRVSLLAEVALNYIDVRTYQTRISVANANLAAQEETYGLARSRYQAGLGDELAVQQARYNLEQTRSRIPTLQSSLEAAENRLAVLLGESPGALRSLLKSPQPVPVPSVNIAVGIPADLLRRRPDIRQAERNLAAQTARIGVAESELYPKFTLSGSVGLEALSSGDLFSADSRSHSFGPRFSWRIFDAGAIRQNIEVQSASAEQALLRYESSVLNALEEVENALTAYVAEQQRGQTLTAATRAAQEASKLAGNKYSAGLTDFDTVLEAQRSLLNLEDQLAESKGNTTADLVRLYKALGGGWGE
ncbi:MAG: RND transporter [Desulfobacteraceae bacterium IS3]|nr:MAG: RND transporter [Desulfobacteraceae bacterium IS3]